MLTSIDVSPPHACACPPARLNPDAGAGWLRRRGGCSACASRCRRPCPAPARRAVRPVHGRPGAAAARRAARVRPSRGETSTAQKGGRLLREHTQAARRSDGPRALASLARTQDFRRAAGSCSLLWRRAVRPGTRYGRARACRRARASTVPRATRRWTCWMVRDGKEGREERAVFVRGREMPPSLLSLQNDPSIPPLGPPPSITVRRPQTCTLPRATARWCGGRAMAARTLW